MVTESSLNEPGSKLDKHLRDLIFAVASYDVDANERLHDALEGLLWAMSDKQLWDYYRRDRIGCGGSDCGDDPARILRGPACPECGNDLRWVEHVAEGIYTGMGECGFCEGPPLIVA